MTPTNPPKSEPVRYELLDVSGQSSCPECHSTVELLCPQNIKDMPGNPAFYICWTCHRVGQVAVGQVKRQTIEAG